MDQVLLLDAAAKLQYWNITTGAVRFAGQVQGGLAVSDMTVMPDGQIIVSAGSALYVLDPDTLVPTLLIDLDDGRTAGLGHTPEGALLISYADAARIDEMDLDTLEITGSIDMGVDFTGGDVVADAGFVYVATQGQTIDVYARDTGLLESSTPHGLGGIVFGLSYHDGVIAYANGMAYRVAPDGTTLVQDLELTVPVYGASVLPEIIREGTAEDDTITGRVWDEMLRGGAGDDIIDGDAGDDTALYDGDRAAYSIVIDGEDIHIADRSGTEGTDTLTHIETLRFADQDWALDRFTDLAGLSAADLTQFVEMYIAYFNRAPDAEGLFFWGSALQNGTTLQEAAAYFFDQTETRMLYPDDTTTEEFVQTIYGNVLGRPIDQDGFDFWVRVLDAGDVDRPTFMLDIIAGAKAPSRDGASQAFIDQKAADVAYLSDKTDLGLYFSVILGMSNVENARDTMSFFDGSPEGLMAAKDAIDDVYAEATEADTGEFLLSLVGVVDDPFVI